MFSMTFQPPSQDSAIPTVWDLAQFNVALQGGILQSGRMIFNCYSSTQNIGNPAKILSSQSYDLTAAQILAFQTANNLAPGQIATFAYGLAKSIQNVVATPAVLNDDGSVKTPTVMTSFFANASTA